MKAALEQSQRAIQDLTNKLNQLLSNGINIPPNTEKPERKPGNNHGGYCWSHGFWVGKNHNSETCKNPKPGHKTTATAQNQMGGVHHQHTSTQAPPDSLRLLTPHFLYSTSAQSKVQKNVSPSVHCSNLPGRCHLSSSRKSSRRKQEVEKSKPASDLNCSWM